MRYFLAIFYSDSLASFGLAAQRSGLSCRLAALANATGIRVEADFETQKRPDLARRKAVGYSPVLGRAGSGFTDGGAYSTLFLARECRYDPHQYSSQCQALFRPGGCYIVHGTR